METRWIQAQVSIHTSTKRPPLYSWCHRTISAMWSLKRFESAEQNKPTTTRGTVHPLVTHNVIGARVKLEMEKLGCPLISTLTQQEPEARSFFSYIQLFLWFSFEKDGNHTTHIYNTHSQPNPWTTLSKTFCIFPLRNLFLPLTTSVLEHCSERLALLETDFKWHDRLICEEGKINAFIFNSYTQDVAFHMSIARQQK